VLITGTILAARDAAHKRLVETLDRREPLPVDLQGAVVYYLGPSPARPGHPIGAAGPTTSGRMDAYTPRLLKQGLKGMIGKGYRSPDVIKAMEEFGVPYLAAVGGAGALIARSIRKYTVLAYEDLGPEAVAAMEVEDFPAIVVIDCLGGNYYEAGQAPYRRI
jgi:fumarate hydratase subunit beta